MSLFPKLLNYCQNLSEGFASIADERKTNLNSIAAYIRQKSDKNETIKLNFICTHNSRRSQFGQAWAKAIAAFFETDSLVESYSGGTEATTFNTNAVKALQKAGFSISVSGENEKNLVYEVKISNNDKPLKMFSKVFDAKENPSDGFAAIMVCNNADEACPFVAGAEKRFSLPFSDPKNADGTSEQEAEYDKICLQIATELLYVFDKANLKSKQN